MRRLILAMSLLLAACTPRAEILPVPAGAPVLEEREVFVGATRALDPATGLFTTERSTALNFARFDVSVPPERAAGSVPFPGRREAPDPQRHFLVAEARNHADAAEFRADLARALRTHPRREVVVFVHGFNNTFAESLYRFAQITHDLQLPGVAVHYAWPSAASPLAYARDRDSALLARDGFEQLLREIEAAGARQITILAHSMGAHLTMETLRQLSVAGHDDVADRISGVVLMSPDIDVTLFRAQAGRIGELPQPFVIFTSSRDRALQLSAFLTGERDRLGTVRDLSTLADLDVTVFDVSEFSVGDGHFNLARSPLLLGVLGRVGELDAAFSGDPGRRTGLLPGTVLTLRRATRVILSPVEALAEIGN